MKPTCTSISAFQIPASTKKKCSFHSNPPTTCFNTILSERETKTMEKRHKKRQKKHRFFRGSSCTFKNLQTNIWYTKNGELTWFFTKTHFFTKTYLLAQQRQGLDHVCNFLGSRVKIQKKMFEVSPASKVCVCWKPWVFSEVLSERNEKFKDEHTNVG